MTDIDKRIIEAFPSGFDLAKHTVCLAKVGSASHNTYVPHDDPESIDDVDYLGVAIPSVQRTIGLSPWEHWTLQQDELDVVYFSLRKLVGLLLKSNPNVVGLLWLEPECYIHVHPLFRKFIEKREIFSSKKIYASFSGYAAGQIYKMEHGAHKGYMGEKRKRLVEKFGYDCKNASHAIRLLRMGTEFLENSRLQVFRTDDAGQLRDIKSGKWTLEQVKAEADKLFDRAKQAVSDSKLPDEPNYEEAERLMLSTTLTFWLQTDGAGMIGIRPGRPSPYLET